MMVGLFLGAAVGAGLALLFAPMSGDDTRRRIAGSARKLQNDTQDTMDDMKERMADGAKDVSSALDAGKDAFMRTVDQVASAQDRV
jgi:gas vesicle protein